MARLSPQDLFAMFQSVGNNLGNAWGQSNFNDAFKQQMQPQTQNQWTPLQQGQPGQTLPYSPQAQQAGGYNQQVQVTPDILSALQQVIAKNPGMAQYAQPIYQSQMEAGAAAKAPILEQNAGQQGTNLITGKIYSPPPFKNPTDTEDWHQSYDVNGQPLSQKIPGTNATRLVEEKKTSDGTKITRLAAGGTEPIGNSLNPTSTKESVDMVARNYLLKGESALGVFGRNTVARNQAVERAAEINKEGNFTDAERQQIQATTKAQGNSLSNLTKQRDAVLTFEKTAEMNLDRALKLSGAVDRVQSPVVNRWKLWVQRQGAGDPDVFAFDAALKVAANEVAKVTSTTTGNMVTQQEREEYGKLLNAALNMKSIKSVSDVLKADMGSRKTAYEQQINEIKKGFPTLDRTSEQTTGQPIDLKSKYGLE
jgi:hypothetical protein